MSDPDAATMPAGAEMDRLVAERVMGWTYHPDKHRPDVYAYGFWRSAGSDLDVGADSWSPSTNIAHAWEVVERMAPQLRQRNGHTPYYAIVRTRGGYVAGYWTDVPFLTCPAPTAPLAICRAALNAERQ